MIQKGTLFLILALMSLSATSQNAWPKKIVLDNDTGIIFTPHQVVLMNGVFIDRDECLEMKDSLNSQLNTYASLVVAQDSNIMNLQAHVEVYDNITIEQEEIIALNEKKNRKQKRKIGFLKLTNGFSLVAVAVLTIIIFVK